MAREGEPFYRRPCALIAPRSAPLSGHLYVRTHIRSNDRAQGQARGSIYTSDLSALAVANHNLGISATPIDFSRAARARPDSKRFPSLHNHAYARFFHRRGCAFPVPNPPSTRERFISWISLDGLGERSIGKGFKTSLNVVLSREFRTVY